MNWNDLTKEKLEKVLPDLVASDERRKNAVDLLTRCLGKEAGIHLIGEVLQHPAFALNRGRELKASEEREEKLKLVRETNTKAFEIGDHSIGVA